MLKKDIKNPFPDAESFYEEETPSTMLLAGILAEKKKESGTVVYTRFQTEGRGRTQGRRWESGKGDSLLFTILFKKEDIPFTLSLFPLFSGFCLAECLRKSLGIHTEVKWPNDLLYDGKKISGILCEYTGGYLLCGMGVNLLQEKFTDTRIPACSVKSVSGKVMTPEKMLELLLFYFRMNLENRGWKADFEKILYKKGEKIVINCGLAGSEEILSGILEGIGEEGELLIREHEGKIRKIYTGEMIF